jgi:hypothetical protein
VSPMTCRDCSGLFIFLPRGVCVACQTERERRFQEVRDWLVSRPDATMVDVTDALGVDESLVTHWIREGRLRTIAPSPDAAARARVEQQLRERVTARWAGRSAFDIEPGMRSKTQ